MTPEERHARKLRIEDLNKQTDILFNAIEQMGDCIEISERSGDGVLSIELKPGAVEAIHSVLMEYNTLLTM